VSEARPDEREQAVDLLALQLVVHLGAPDEATARPAAEEEIALAEDLCRGHAIGTLIALQRIEEDGTIRERFRTLKPRDQTAYSADYLRGHGRAFEFFETEDDEVFDLRHGTGRPDMREFWVASGHQLTRLDAHGRMIVTDELILAWLARPEVLPPPEACFFERALHARLMRAPRDPVTPGQIAAMADPDARENWEFLILLRDTLTAAGTVEGGYLQLVRQGVRLPVVFYDQLVQLILRNALDGCEDVFTLRAAEMFFRAQRAHFDKGALLLADDELVRELEAESHTNPLMAMLQGGVSALDVLGEGNAWTYWSRSDAHAMVLPFGADPKGPRGPRAGDRRISGPPLGH
jgi:hypothetical protein